MNSRLKDLQIVIWRFDMSVKVKISGVDIKKFKEVFELDNFPEYGEEFNYQNIVIVNMTPKKNISESGIVSFVLENIDGISVGVISSAIFTLATYSIKSILKLNNEKVFIEEEVINKKLTHQFKIGEYEAKEVYEYEETHCVRKKNIR
jgi:hypothetical protein